MKTLLTTLFWFTLGVNCFSQTHQMVIQTPSNPNQMIWWYVRDASTNQIVYEHTHTNASELSVFQINLASGNYFFVLSNSNCESSTGGVYAFTSNSEVISSSNQNFGCSVNVYFTFKNTTPCDDSCPSDLDGDGITSVSDLLIFISAYGTICEE